MWKKNDTSYSWYAFNDVEHVGTGSARTWILHALFAAELCTRDVGIKNIYSREAIWLYSDIIFISYSSSGLSLWTVFLLEKRSYAEMRRFNNAFARHSLRFAYNRSQLHNKCYRIVATASWEIAAWFFFLPLASRNFDR